MIIEKEVSYARPSRFTRVCPACQYSCGLDENYVTKFTKLQKVVNCETSQSVQLYACPKCGTIGIDVEKN